MIKCQYRARNYPVSYSKSETFETINPEHFVICHVLAGCAVLTINDYPCYLTPHTVLLFPRHTSVKVRGLYRFEAQTISFHPSFINVNLDWDLIEAPYYLQTAQQYGYPDFLLFYRGQIPFEGILPLDEPLSDRVKELFAAVITQFTTQPDAIWSCRSRSYLFDLYELLEHHQKRLFSSSSAVKPLEEQVLDYICLNICKPINVQKLCDLFYTNRTTLCKKFKALTGCSIIAYVMQKRLDLAKHTLAFTNLTIEEIAQKYGFHDAPYFIKMFTKNVGTSPTKYRIEMQKKRGYSAS